MTGDWEARDRLTEKAGGRTTVPQIWIGETHVGGSDELAALERAGKLDALLAAEGSGAPWLATRRWLPIATWATCGASSFGARVRVPRAFPPGTPSDLARLPAFAIRVTSAS